MGDLTFLIATKMRINTKGRQQWAVTGTKDSTFAFAHHRHAVYAPEAMRPELESCVRISDPVTFRGSEFSDAK